VSIDVGRQTSWRTSDLPTGQRYYFAVRRAYGPGREMGDFSAELSADLQGTRKRDAAACHASPTSMAISVTICWPTIRAPGRFGLGLSRGDSFRQLWGQWTSGLAISGANFDNDGKDDLLFYSPEKGTWAGGVSRGDGTFDVVQGDWVPGAACRPAT